MNTIRSSEHRPSVLVITGYGFNCEAESITAWRMAGADPRPLHFADLIASPDALTTARALMFIGGFSFGDHMGSGHVIASRLRHRLRPVLEEYLAAGGLVLGICNGFQILANLGLVPAFGRTPAREIALMPNRKGVLECRFVTLKPASENLWTRGISHLYCPVSHGEGNFYCTDETLNRLESGGMVAFTYCRDDLGPANGEFPYNPNGSRADIAGITSEDGKVLGMMPHPERAMEFVNLYDWPLMKEKLVREGKPLPSESVNMRLFHNIVDFFRG